MDRRPILGFAPAHTGATDQIWSTGNLHFQHKTGTEHTDSHGRRRNRLRNRPRPISPRSTGNKLGMLRRSQECPIRKNGTRTKNNSGRRQNLGFRTGGRRNIKKFSTDHQLLMTETTNDPDLLKKKPLVCLERQQHDLKPEEYLAHKKKLSSRFGLVFIEDKIIVPKNLRNIQLLHKGHPATNKMSLATRREEIQKKCDNSSVWSYEELKQQVTAAQSRTALCRSRTI